MANRGFCGNCSVYTAAGEACPTCGNQTILVPEMEGFPSSFGGRGKLDMEDSQADGLTWAEFLPEEEIAGDGPDRLKAPFSIVLADDGSFLVMDSDGAVVRLVRFSREGRLAGVVARFPSPGLDLASPHGVALGPDGRLYVPDAGNDRIVILSPEGQAAGEIKPDRVSEYALCYPKDVDLDDSGRVYIADSFNNRILRMDRSGRFDLVLGVNVDMDDDGCRDAGARPGEFDEPAGVTGDADGKIYVADTNNHRLQVFDRDGSLLLAIGKEGVGLGEFSFPSDVRVGQDGSIYVADRSNTRIQQFSQAGVLQAHFSLNELAGASEAAVGDVDVGPGGVVYVPLPDRGVVVKGRMSRARREK